MSLPIFFIDTFNLTGNITLNEEASKHIVQVLRMKPLDKLQLTDGAGVLLTAQIADAHKKKCTVTVIEKQLIPRKQQEVCIAISLVKNATRFEWFLEKATEIGVTEIIPMLCERTEKQHFRYDRMKQILVSAMIQSKQAWLPVLKQPTAFESVLADVAYQNRLIAHCIEDRKESLKNFIPHQSTQVLIGPEGDFSPAEIALALQYNYVPVTLGATRLRTETAGVVAATLLCI